MRARSTEGLDGARSSLPRGVGRALGDRSEGKVMRIRQAACQLYGGRRVSCFTLRGADTY